MAEVIERLETEMREAAKKFEFERAAQLRDKARALRAKLI
jgi:excinuclease ABC subunit B